MNKSALKKFAWDARNLLMEDVRNRALGLGITQSVYPTATSYQGGIRLSSGRELDDIISLQWANLRSRWESRGFDALIEDTAYTWFNRFIALRYMEVNGFLDHGIHVVQGRAGDLDGEPEILSRALEAAIGIDMNRYVRLREANKTSELYRYVLTCQCNALHPLLPKMFEQDGDCTEILLPVEGIMKVGGFRRRLLEDIDEADWREGVEIIGWLYQFYIAEKKDKYFASKEKVTRDTLPAATQLFTPEWIVRYLIENSVGRLWVENKGGIMADSQPQAIRDLKANWRYYIDTPEQPEDVLKTLEQARNTALQPTEITVLDPAMGSGHMLVYAFDVLYQIYLSQGYSSKMIPELILKNNLYGLDIDDRAAQLAYFAVMMRALSYDRRILQKGVEPHVMDIIESPVLDRDWIDYLADRKPINRAMWQGLLDCFKDADLLGSLIQPEGIDFDALEVRINELKDTPVPLTIRKMEGIWETLGALVQQGRILSAKHDVVVTNPPYMSRSAFSLKLISFVDVKYPDSKYDLFSVFMEVCSNLTNLKGYTSIINQQSWMFLSSYERLRSNIVASRTMINMIHLGARAFAEIGGEVVQSTAFVFSNSKMKQFRGVYLRLVRFSNSDSKEEKTLEAIHIHSVPYYYVTSSENFEKIPGQPIAYWVGKKVVDSFTKMASLATISEIVSGMTTGNNDLYLRYWIEIDFRKISLNKKSVAEIDLANTYWVPYNKGGTFRRWYGNNEFLVNWSCSKNFNRAKTTMTHLYLKKCITWADITPSSFAARACEYGFFFDVKGSCAFPHDDVYFPLISFLNSKVTMFYIKLINPTITTQVGDLKRIPFSKNANIPKVKEKAIENIKIAKTDWDSFETSWDFSTHPLHTHLTPDRLLSTAFINWQQAAAVRFQTLKHNEEELNRIFIDIYGLQDELTPDVPDEEITVRHADRTREAKSFLSWFIGCTFGRYSPDKPGLIFAGGDFLKSFTPVKQLPGSADAGIHRPWWRFEDGHPQESSIDLCEYNIIPLTEQDYFGDEDIISRLKAFLDSLCGDIRSPQERRRIVAENMKWLGQSIDPKATDAAEALRKYFLKDFMKDHLKIYKNRPIYWLFDSGKQNGFKALIYLHRYRKDTVARLRMDYLLRLQNGYETELARVNLKPESEMTGSERKQRDALRKKIDECMAYDRAVAHMASRQVELELDDGVRINYMKLQNIDDGRGGKINLLYPVDMKVEE